MCACVLSTLPAFIVTRMGYVLRDILGKVLLLSDGICLVGKRSCDGHKSDG